MTGRNAGRITRTAILCFAAVAAQSATLDARGDAVAPRLATKELASARVPFIENRGQLDSGTVRFYARTFAGVVFLTVDGSLVYALPERGGDGPSASWSFRESFSGARPALVRGDSPSAIMVSHFKGPDPGAWRSSLSTFDGVDLGELYEGIRVTLRASGDNVEKLFHVAPGADVAAIDVSIDGVDGLDVDSAGRLLLSTSLGDIVFTAPEAFQTVDGDRRQVPVSYVLREGRRYGFAVGEYDPHRELVIDPLLASTYLGGHNPSPPGNYDDDIVWGMAASGGEVYVAGATQSPDFPVHLGYDETLANSYPDGFITRMSGDLSTVIASTYIGTDGFDFVTDIALEESGTIIAVGEAGWGFPVTDGAYVWNGSTPSGGGFVARFSADLSTLEASAIVTPGDYPATVALGNGGIYFGGGTDNPDFPITPGAFLSTCCPAGGFGIREYNGFAGKLSADLTSLLALTYLDGRTVTGIAVAPQGSVFVTDGFDYAVTGSIARLDDGLTTRSAYRSYYPGSTSGSTRTYFNDVAVTDEHVVTVGETYMRDLPATAGAFDTTCGTDGLCDGIGDLLVPKSDGFVAIYSHDLQQTLALTFLGGSSYDTIRSVVLGADGGIYVAGETMSADLPTAGDGVDTMCGIDGACDPAGPYDPTIDAFVARLSPDLSQLDFGSYLGGSGEDRPTVIAMDETGLIYVAGRTSSFDFPTSAGAFDPTYNGGTSDAFISLFETGFRDAGTTIFTDGFEVGQMAAWDGS